MTYDVVIIGGSFAGLAAAMQLVRAQRHVLVIDANKPRNRFAAASHGVFGLDGKSPAQIREIGLKQLSAYPTFEIVEGTVERLEPTQAGFSVLIENQEEVSAQRIILASGVRDCLPNIEGLSRYWGKNVVHCPYCHGYELKDRRLGVLATTEMSLHQAAMIPDWGTTILFTQGTFEPEAELKALLEKRGVEIESSPIIRVEGDTMLLQKVILGNNKSISLGGLYVSPKTEIGNPLIEPLDLELSETLLGNIVQVDVFKESSVKGLFVAGDLSNPMQNGTLAVASGTLAGIGAHRSLVFEGVLEREL